MNNASLELGGTNWAEKDGNILGYSVGDTSGNFSPQEFTFARGSNLSATRIDRAGLIVKGRENLLLQSNQFDTTWVITSAAVTSGQSGYDGSSDAWLFSKGGINGRIQQNLSFSSVGTFSVYAKSGTNDWIRLIDNNSQGAYFDLSGSGAVGTQSGGVIKANIESVGGGWHRCSVLVSWGSANFRIYVADADNDTSGTSGSIYIQDAQIEQGLAASPYIETTTTTAQAGVLENTPRLNYTTGVANPYLLLEPSRTNRLANSENGYGWSTSNVTVLPFDGGINGKYFQLTSDASASRFNVIANPWVNLAAATYTASVFAKKGTTDEIILTSRANYTAASAYSTFNLTSGTVASNGVVGSIEPYSDGWYRCSITFTNPGSYSDFASFAYGFNFNASSTDTLFVTAPQSEIGSYPTSYIPTYSVSATRAKDVCNKLGSSDLIGHTEGTIFIDVKMPSAIESNTTFSIGAGTSGEYAQIEIRTDLSINWRYRQGGTDYINANVGSYAAGDRLKIGFGYKNADSILYLNGSSIATDTGSITTNAWDEVRFSNYIGTGNLNADVNQSELYKERLTNAELATLTTI